MVKFSQAIESSGLGSPSIISDGAIHRYSGPDDKTGAKNHWYVGFQTGGAAGNWKTGYQIKWYDGSTRSKDDDAALVRQIQQAQKQRKSEIARNQKRTQERARYLWASGVETIIHPYPKSKQITPYGTRQKDNRLLLPMYYRGELWSVQQIHQDGTKRFLKGGRVAGCYMPLGALSEAVYICEGYATGCSLYQNTGTAIAVAFNAGNLKKAALTIRKQHPDIQITIAADNDINTEGNPGLTKGLEAAAAVGGDVLYPDFSDEPVDGTDWNDYLTQGGAL